MTLDLFYKICAGIGIVVFSILYPWWTKKKANNNKWPKSYSHTYKIWENHSNRGYLFTGWVGGNIIFMLPGLLYSATTEIQFILPFVALTALWVVGIKPSGIDSDTTRIHCIAAQICAILSTVNVGLHGYWEMALITLGLLFIWSKLFQQKYETLIMEFGAFLIAYFTIILCN
jgi:hypothetical protein